MNNLHRIQIEVSAKFLLDIARWMFYLVAVVSLVTLLKN